MNKEDFVNGLKTASEKLNEEEIKSIIEDSLRPLQSNDTGLLNLIIVMEEFNEVAMEVSKYIRGKDNKTELLEELADAYMCIKYIQCICNISDEELNKAINVKAQRQKNRNDQKSW